MESEDCCKLKKEKCPGSKLGKGPHEGCKALKGAEKAECCKKCGHIKGTELCCKLGQKKCSDCGMVKGSPGCCAMKK